MQQFTRATIVAVSDVLSELTEPNLDRLVLGLGLENLTTLCRSKREKANEVAGHLLKNPDLRNDYGENLTEDFVTQLVNKALEQVTASNYGTFDYGKFGEKYPGLNRALMRDGFTVEGGSLRRALPDEVDLPSADNEVHDLLRQLEMTTALGHLDQGIRSHSRGDYASANAQFRTCLESVLDDTAQKLAAGAALGPSHANKRQWLGNCTPPFFDGGLNEWDKGKEREGFVETLFRRLCPEGSHPGLSDEDDSTFRLHMVLLNLRVFLRRLKRRLGT